MKRDLRTGCPSCDSLNNNWKMLRHTSLAKDCFATNTHPSNGVTKFTAVTSRRYSVLLGVIRTPTADIRPPVCLPLAFTILQFRRQTPRYSELTQWSWVLEKLTVAELFRTYLVLYGRRSSPSFSQEETWALVENTFSTVSISFANSHWILPSSRGSRKVVCNLHPKLA